MIISHSAARDRRLAAGLVILYGIFLLATNSRVSVFEDEAQMVGLAARGESATANLAANLQQHKQTEKKGGPLELRGIRGGSRKFHHRLFAQKTWFPAFSPVRRRPGATMVGVAIKVTNHCRDEVRNMQAAQRLPVWPAEPPAVIADQDIRQFFLKVL